MKKVFILLVLFACTLSVFAEENPIDMYIFPKKMSYWSVLMQKTLSLGFVK